MMALLGAHNHDAITKEYQRLITKWRRKLFVPATWQIDLQVRCPQDMHQGAIGYCVWGYLPNNTFELGFRCDLSPAERNWTVPHELLEALMAPYAELAEEYISQEQNRSKRVFELRTKQHGDVRNQIIEHLLCVIVGHERPSRMY